MATRDNPLQRRRDGAVLGGVCSGLGDALGVDSLVVRIGFVAAATAGGAGVVLYLLAWLALPGDDGRALIGRFTNASVGTAVAGVLCVIGAAVLALRQLGVWFSGAASVPTVVSAVMLALLAAGLLLAPWWLRLVRAYATERAERIRNQERAELAAHLHDSVLQTLALVQRRADDPREVTQLARRQERELRAWLAGQDPTRADAATTSLAQALERAAADVEAAHRVPIEVVTVGDLPLDSRGEALVAAAREALTNAVKFAPDSPISAYLEVEEGRARVFVRDRGPGFDPENLPADRRGVRESILARMDRHGGSARVHSSPGAGTEIELAL